MKHLYVIIERDEKGDLIYKPTHYMRMLKAFAATSIFLMWDFGYKGNQITIYAGTLSGIPIDEKPKEIERRVLMALGLV